MKKAIAMKCTQEQWDSIKDRIPEEMISNLKGDVNYITNVYYGHYISNIGYGDGTYKGFEIHETFNAKIFLDACGIETETKFEITKEQIIQLHHNTIHEKDQLVVADLKNWFPEVFKKPFKGWAKDACIGNEKWLGYFENDILAYGFDSHENWFKDKYKCATYSGCKSHTEATPQEVESALICEAKKRWLVNGASYLSPNKRFKRVVKYPLKLDKRVLIDAENHYIFDCGVFATIIHPEKMTLEQIEKELGRKIEIV